MVVLRSYILEVGQKSRLLRKAGFLRSFQDQIEAQYKPSTSHTGSSLEPRKHLKCLSLGTMKNFKLIISPSWKLLTAVHTQDPGVNFLLTPATTYLLSP